MFIKDTYITDLLRRNAAERAKQAAVVFEGKQINWTELWREVELTAPYFSHKLSNQQQEVAAILLPNSIEFIVAYLSILHAGHIALLLDPAYKKLEQEAIIKNLGVKLIITDRDYRQHVARTEAEIVYIDDLSDNTPPEKYLRLPPHEQVASLTFTSGTTGTPKAVPNTHTNHLWNIKVCSQVWDWTPADTLLVSVPLSHMLGVVMGLSGALYHGNTIYLHRWFDEEEILKVLSSGKVSFFSHAASAYVKLVASPDKGYDLSKVRLCVSGGAPLPPAVWEEFKDRYNIEILETYGTSETGRIAGNRLNKRVLGSPGQPLPEVKLRIGQHGEVEVKSPGLFPGYYKNPEATKAALTTDGFWRTGDIGELRDGYVYLKGRVQERIRRFGYTISPRDVEWALHQLPEVKDIYVMGRQRNDQPNDELIYFIVTDLDDEVINDFCKKNLLFAWRPDKIVHLDELPRTRSGKTRIGTLRQMVSGAA